MNSEESLLSCLRAMGIQPTDTLCVHTSLKAVGPIAAEAPLTGADVMLAALRKSVAEGLLIIPSHTWNNIQVTPVFDVKNTVPCIGTLPRIAVEYANAAYERGDSSIVRSMHPSHSVVAFGKRAAEYAAHDLTVPLPLDRHGCFGSLIDEKAKILLIGVDLRCNTFIHVVDECFDPTCVTASYPITRIGYDGIETPWEVCHTRDLSSEFSRFQPEMEARGALFFGKIGNADAMLCRADECFTIVTEILEKEKAQQTAPHSGT